MSEFLNAGSGPSSAMVAAADAYQNGVLKNQAIANSLFDRFANFAKSIQDEKRKQTLYKQADESFELNKANANLQHQLLQKQKDYYDQDKALEKRKTNALIGQMQSQSALSNENLKNMRQEFKEKQDYLNFLKANPNLNFSNPLPNNNPNPNVINEDDLNQILNQENFSPNRN